MPFSPEGIPKRVEGKANFTDKSVFYPMQDSTMVFAEWRGNVKIILTKRTYK
ncbi:MAG: hypothetical protein AAF298_25090 [Cyanobacteria bacterium P01_A01_bin.40]